MHTKSLNYAKLADIEQGEKKRLQETLCWSQKYRERNDFLLSQLQISVVSYKNRRLDQIGLQKTVTAGSDGILW